MLLNESEKKYLTVTELNNFVKGFIDNNPFLNNVWFKGEISSYKSYPSGHTYLDIKDKDSTVKAVIWASNNRLKFSPKIGDLVLIKGQATFYPKAGSFQISIKEMNLDGQGDLLAKLEELKKKLSKEGLFDESRKRPLKRFNFKIGVISAEGSAAFADIKKNIFRRFPLADIYFFPSSVQGESAPTELVEAFKKSQKENLDVLIISRGGGSNDDLMAFNDETLVRAVATSKFPVVSAVGHEVDFTLLDFVADVRVSTPTAAAEAVTIDKEDLKLNLDGIYDFLNQNLNKKLDFYKNKVNLLSQRQFFNHPESMYQNAIQKLEGYDQQIKSYIKNILLIKNDRFKYLDKQLNININNLLNFKTGEVKRHNDRLNALNPEKILGRGYSIIKNKNNKIIKSIKDVSIDEEIVTSFQDGTIKSKVLGKEKA